LLRHYPPRPKLLLRSGERQSIVEWLCVHHRCDKLHLPEGATLVDLTLPERAHPCERSARAWLLGDDGLLSSMCEVKRRGPCCAQQPRPLKEARTMHRYLPRSCLQSRYSKDNRDVHRAM